MDNWRYRLWNLLPPIRNCISETIKWPPRSLLPSIHSCDKMTLYHKTVGIHNSNHRPKANRGTEPQSDSAATGFREGPQQRAQWLLRNWSEASISERCSAPLSQNKKRHHKNTKNAEEIEGIKRGAVVSKERGRHIANTNVFSLGVHRYRHQYLVSVSIPGLSTLLVLVK